MLRNVRRMHAHAHGSAGGCHGRMHAAPPMLQLLLQTPSGTASPAYGSSELDEQYARALLGQVPPRRPAHGPAVPCPPAPVQLSRPRLRPHVRGAVCTVL